MSLDPKDFRRALGSFASGVTVVAAEHADGLQGMTASAFISVSMDPPLVLVSVSRRAQFHAAPPRAGGYTVSVLAADQEALSAHFAGRPDPQLQVSWERTSRGTPVLAGALATIDCTLETAVEAGDHTLYVGRVVEVAVHERPPLLYWRGGYRRLGE